MSDDLNEYQKRAKKKLRKHKEKMAKENGKEPMNIRDGENIKARLRKVERDIKKLSHLEGVISM